MSRRITADEWLEVPQAQASSADSPDSATTIPKPGPAPLQIDAKSIREILSELTKLQEDSLRLNRRLLEAFDQS